jgi:hypothetical protein
MAVIKLPKDTPQQAITATFSRHQQQYPTPQRQPQPHLLYATTAKTQDAITARHSRCFKIKTKSS